MEKKKIRENEMGKRYSKYVETAPLATLNCCEVENSKIKHSHEDIEHILRHFDELFPTHANKALAAIERLRAERPGIKFLAGDGTWK